MIIKLYYTRNSYNVILSANKGIESVSLTGSATVTNTGNTYSVRFGDTIILSATENAGYTFADWTKDEGCANVNITNANSKNATFTMPAGNVMLTANATANTDTAYQVNYYVQKADKTFVLDSKFDEYSISTNTAGKAGTTDTLAPIDTLSEITYTGMKYSYYTITRTGVTEPEINGSLNIDGDGMLVINLYYVRETYKLTLNTSVGIATVTANVGTGISKAEEENTYDVMYNINVQLGHTLTADGYEFIGWVDSAEDNKVVVDSSERFVMPTRSVVLTATANANLYTITLHGNGGLTADSKDTFDVSATYDADVTLPVNPFTKPGYTFLGWSTTEGEDAEIVYENQATFKYEIADDSDLYAVWGENTYTIVYNSNNGSGTIADTVATYDTAVQLNANTFTRTGYTFAGWSTDPKATSFENVANATTKGIYFDGTNYSAYNLTEQGTITIYAIWSENSYTLILDGNDDIGLYQGTAELIDGKSATQTLKYETENADLTSVYTRTGYTFVSWNTEANGSGTSYLANETPNKLVSTNGGEITLYAIWKAVEVNYKVVVYEQNIDASSDEKNDTNFTSVSSETYTALTDSSITVSDYVVVKTGFEYAGFTTNKGNSVIVVADGSLEISLWYTRNTYSLTVNKVSGDNGIASVEGSGAYDYDKQVTISATINEGYTFAGFTSSNPDLIANITSGWTTQGNVYSYTFKMPAGDVVLTASTTKNANTKFNIVYLFESLEGEFVEDESLSATFAKVGYGPTESVITREMIEEANKGSEETGSIPTVKGFKFTNFGILNGETYYSVTINGDGSSVVNVYYARMSYTFTVNYYYVDTTTPITSAFSITLKHEETYSKDSPVITGYTADRDSVSCKIDGDNVVENVYYTANKYTITYDANGGEVSPSTQEFTIENDINLAQPTRTGFTFAYWLVTKVDAETSFHMDEQFTTMVNKGAYGNVTLTAQWKAETNTITYHLSNVELVSGPENNEIASGVDFEAEVSANTGWTLPTTITVVINERTLDAGEYTYENGTISIDGELVVGDIEITVTATANRYNAIINTTNTTVSVDNVDYKDSITQEVATGTTLTIYAKANTGYGRSGIVFTVTAGKATISEVSEENGVYSVEVSYYTDTFTIMATATINNYTLTINPVGGNYEGSTEVVEITKNYNDTLTISDPVLTGYSFKGWTLTATAGGEATGVFDDETNTYTFGAGNDTLTANWEVNRYKVVIDLNDSVAGNGSTAATSSVGTVNNGKVELYVTYGTTYAEMYLNSVVTAEEIAYSIDDIIVEREGYTFNGFYTERIILGSSVSGQKISANTNFATANNDTVIYAYWTTNDNTAYTVYHRQANLGVYNNFTDENTTLVDTDDLTGETDSVVTPATKTYDGFKSPVVQELTITADGKASITYYYAREEYSLTLEAGNGVASIGATGTGLIEQVAEGDVNAKVYLVQYDATVSLTATAKTGYSMTGFEGYEVNGLQLTEENTMATATMTMPNSTVQLVATASANRYVVRLNVNAGSDNVVSANTDAQVVDGIITLYGEYDGTYGTLYTADEKAVTLASLALKRTGHTFAGWFTTAIEADADTTSATEITATDKFTLTAESEIYAYWTINSYTLTAQYVYSQDSIEGIAGTKAFEDKSITVKYNTEAYIDSPVLYGYKADQTRVGYANMPAGDETIIVTYTANEYTITYDELGGTISGVAGTDYTTTYTKEEVINLPTVKKEGYTFTGWKVTTADSDLALGNWKEGDIYSENSIPAGMYGKVTLTAVWTENTNTAYTINIWKQTTAGGDNYEKQVVTRNDGTTDREITVVKSGTGVSVKDVIYAPDGFTYEETKTTSNNTVEGKFIVKADGTLEIDVYFARNQYTLTINKQEGISSVKVNDAEFTTGQFYYEASIKIDVEVAEGYAWNNFAVSGTELTGFDASALSQTVTMGLGDATLTAQATIRSFTLTIDPAEGLYNGSEEIFKVTQNYASTYTVLTPTREGYTFTGWSKSANFYGNLQESENGYVYTFGVGDDTLTATWEANRYAVILNLNDSNFNNGSTTATVEVTTNENVDLKTLINKGTLTLYATYDSDYSILYTSAKGTDYVEFADILAFTRDGYGFVKWSSNVDGDDEISGSEMCDTTVATTIYAIWNAKPFTLTVDKVDNVSVDVVGATPVAETENQYTVVFDSNVTLTANVDAGYHFKNWTVDEVEKSTELTYNFKYQTASDITVRANIEANQYTIHYDPNGGEGMIADQTATYGVSINLSDGAGFSRNGYTLTGWTYEEQNYSLGASVSDLTTIENGEVTIKAVWEANAYNVVFDTNEGSTVEDLSAVYDKAVEIVGETTKVGYNFLGWSTENGDSANFNTVSSIEGYADLTAYLIGENAEAGIYKFNSKYYVFNLTSEKNGEVVVYAIWAVGVANYRIEYYLENLEGGYTTADETYSKTIESTTGTEVEIEQLTIEGFTVDLNNENTVLSGIVAGDSSLVLRLYYTRNTYTVEFVTPSLGIKSVSGNGSYKYDASVEISVEVSDGYELAQITYGEDGVLTADDLPYTFNISENMTFVVTVTALPFEYKVRFNFENLAGDGYDTDPEVADETFTALVDKEITYDMISEKLVEFDGFTYDRMETGLTVKPSVEDPTIVNVYYTRNSYTLTLQTTKGVESLSAQTNAYVVEITEDVPENEKQYSVKFGATVNLVYKIRQGFEFDGWSSEIVTGDAETGYMIASMPSQNLTIYINATTLKVNFKVHYYLEKMSSSGGDDFENDYVYDSEEIKQGYTDEVIESVEDLNLKTFEGFTYSTFEDGIVITGDGNAVLKVYYLRSSINLTVSMTEGIAKVVATASGEDGAYTISKEFTAQETISVKYGARVEFTYQLVEVDGKSGYTFAGWTGGVQENAGTYYITVGVEALSVSATATNNPYVITFHGNGGKYIRVVEEAEGEEDNAVTEELTELTQAVVYNRNVKLNANLFSRVGYIFQGWSTDPEGGVEYTDEQEFVYEIIGGLDLYAVWKPIKYNVEYDSNGGEGTMTGHTDVLYGTELTLNENQFTLTGYTFNGWSYEADDTQIVTISKDTATVSNLTATNGKTVVLYAVWLENTYTLTYNSNYSSVTTEVEDKLSDPETYKYTQDIVLKDASATELQFAVKGYKFVGWTKDPKATETLLHVGEIVNRLTDVAGGNIVLYAVWTPIAYNIAFDNNGGTGEMANIKNVLYDTEVKLTKATFTKTGYDFAGWTYIDDEGTSHDYIDEDTVKNLTAVDGKTVMLVAKWTATVYTITYLPNEGTFDSSLTLEADGSYKQTFTIEEDITLIDGTKLTKVGYTLIGYTYSEVEGNWSEVTDGDISFEILDGNMISKGVYGNVTLQAKWLVEQYTLTINYKYEGAEEYFDTYTAEVDYGAEYSVMSPSIEGYTPTPATVSGFMDSVDGKVVEVVYSANVYDVTFDLNDQTGSSTAEISYNTVKVVYDSTYAEAYVEVEDAENLTVGLPTPTRTGYTFIGWYLNADLNEAGLITGETVVKITSATTLFAKWTADSNTKYTVEYKFESLDDAEVYELNETLQPSLEGFGTTDTQVTEEMVMALTSNAYPTISGFTFERTILATITADGNAVVTVLYSRNYYTLTLSIEDGISVFTASAQGTSQVEDFYISVVDENIYSVRFEANVVLYNEISDIGYTFGEYTSNEIGLSDLEDGSFKMISGNAEVTATTNPKPYTITFYGNDGTTTEGLSSYTQSGEDVVYKASVTLTENLFAREGYTFYGWALTEEDADNRVVDYIDKDNFVMTTYSENVDLYAVWRPIGYDLTLEGDAGIDISKAVVVVNGEKIELEDKMLVNYGSMVRVYYTYTDENGTTTTLRGGYDFAGFMIGESVVGTGEYYEFEFHGNTVVTLTTTPRTDTRFKVVYQIKDFVTVDYTDIEEVIFENGTTDIAVSNEYLMSLNVIKTYEGYIYTAFADQLGSSTVTIKYGNDTEEGYATTIYIKYNRLPYKLTLNTSVGVQSFIPVETISGTITRIEQDYQVFYETPFNLSLTMFNGYTFDSFTVVAQKSQGSVDLDDGEEWTLTAGEDGYYYGDVKVLSLVYDAESGVYVVEMPAYNITISTNSSANTYQIIYHRNLNNEDTETAEDDVVFDTAYTIKHANTLTWSKPGYEFVGWANSKENADLGNVVYSYVDTNDLPFDAYTYDYDTELWAVWTATDNDYTIEYYFETLDGQFKIDDTFTKVYTGKTDDFVEYETIDKYGFEFDAENENNVLSGNILPNDALVLKVYYKRIWYTLTVNGDIGIMSISAESDYISEESYAEAKFTAKVKHGATITLRFELNPGYRFDKYQESSSTGVDVSSGTFTMPISDISINLMTTANTYHITFKGNGGTYFDEVESVEKDSYTQDFVYMTSSYLTAVKFERDGYTFKNWTITVDAETTLTLEDQELFEYNVVGDLEAVAVWEANPDTKYTVNYYAQKIDGSYELVDTIELQGYTNTEITDEMVQAGFAQVDIAREGYIYNGIREDAPVISGDGLTVVNVEYNLASFDVVFDLTDESGEVATGISSVEFVYNTTEGEDKTVAVSNGTTVSVQYTANFKIKVETLAGYTLKQVVITAFEFSDTFTAEDADEFGYINFVMPTNALEVKVEIETETYTITYHKNLNGDDTTTQYVRYMQENVQLSEMFVETGYTLLGWSDSVGGQKVVYEVGGVIDVYDRTEGLDLYGIWEANKYTIKYNGNTSVGTIEDQVVSYNELVELADGSAFEKTGFTFKGWSLNTDTKTAIEVENKDEIQHSGIYYVTGEDKYYALNLAGETVQNSEVTIYAYWEALKYKVTLAFAEDSDTTYEVGEFEYEQEYNLPAFNTLNWTNVGYEFVGWYYLNDEGERVEIRCGKDETPAVSNLTLVEGKEVMIYAIWGKGMTTFKIRILLQTLNGNYGETEGNYVDVEGNQIETETTVTSETAYNTFIYGTEYQNITGFAYDESHEQDRKVVAGNGTTTVLVYYARQYYELTINKGTNIESVSITTSTNSHSINREDKGYVVYNVKYEDKVTMSLQEAAGYDNGYFEIDIASSVAGAKLEADGISLYMKGQQDDVQLAGNITVNTFAVANKDTRYTIEVYKQNLNSEYDSTPTYTTYSTGETGTEIDQDAVKALVEGNESFDFNGFAYATTSFANGNIIAGDGSTVVRLYYTREHYELTLNISNSNAVVTDAIDSRYLFEEEITLVFTLNKGYSLDKDTGFTITNVDGEPVEGITFEVSEADNDLGTKDYTVVIKMPYQNITLNVLPETNKYTEYKVVYMFQTIDLGTSYEELEEYPSVIKTGETEHIITIEDLELDSIMIEGFALNHTSVDTSEVAIAGDGSTIVYVYYDRVKHTVSVEFIDEMNGMVDDSFSIMVNGAPAVGSGVYEYSVAYGQTIEATFELSAGFTFAGYEVNGELQIENVNGEKLTYTMGDEDITITITIIANNNTQYKLEYYREQLVGDSGATVFEKAFEATKTGTTHQYFAPEIIMSDFIENVANIAGYQEGMFTGFDYAYYTVTAAGEDTTDFAYIAGDGSTVFKFYYIRKMINISIEYDKDQIASVSGEGSYAYGSEVTVTATAKPGYKFDHWLIDGEEIREEEYTFVIDKEVDIELVVVSDVGEAKYVVEHYFEVLDEGYEMRYSDEMTGVTESEIDVDSLIKTEGGFEYSHTENGEAPYYVMGDGSTVVRIYYNLKSVTFTVSYSSGIKSVTVEGYNSADDLELIGYDPVGMVYTYQSKYTKRLSLSVELEAGYELYGWVLNNNKTPENNSNQSRGYLFDVINEDFTLKAVAITKQITIRFNPNNGTSEVIEMQAYYNTTIRLRENTFTNGNKIFLGWALSEGGEIVYFDGDEITVDFDNDLNLYAIWEEREASNWWIYIVIGLLILLILIIIILLIIRKKKNEKRKIMSKQ